MPSPSAAIDFPVSGEWVAINTPAERIPSHGTDFFGQRYAFDFVKLGAGGGSFSTISLWRQFLLFVPAESFLAWNEPVFSVFAGTVLRAEDGWTDRRRVNSVWEMLRANVLQREPDPADLRPLLGNYVLVEGEPGVALFAHLRQGSVRVEPGQSIASGHRVASVGNSGNSTMPHLHFHVMDRADPWQAAGVYCGFRCADAQKEPFVPSAMKPFHASPCADNSKP
jgi:hypothetical protein